MADHQLVAANGPLYGPPLDRSVGRAAMPKLKTQRARLPHMLADSESGPEIRWQAFELILSFTTFQSEKCCVQFIDVDHFEFLSDNELDDKVLPHDGVVEVGDPPLVQQLVASGSVSPTDASTLTHQFIGFNEVGSCSVVPNRSV
ncbi:MAG: hypothetical protein AB7T19_17770 [Planctomycetota bacterium]